MKKEEKEEEKGGGGSGGGGSRGSREVELDRRKRVLLVDWIRMVAAEGDRVKAEE